MIDILILCEMYSHKLVVMIHAQEHMVASSVVRRHASDLNSERHTTTEVSVVDDACYPNIYRLRTTKYKWYKE